MKKSHKSPTLFFCEICDYSTSSCSDFRKHNFTRKHLMATAGKEKNASSIYYSCSFCKFTTINKYNYDEHLLTKKHQKNTISETTALKHTCSNCNKEYINYNALWKHSKKCVVVNNDILQNNLTQSNIISKDSFTPELFMEVLNQSKELQNVLVEQTKELQNKLLEQNKEHNQQIIELAKNQSIVNNNNNTTNQQFNLQFFLNETCKDAMNIMDFVNSLQLTTEDFETTGKLGFVDGISRIFIKELKKIDTEKLPIHCTDFKRETVYIKDNNTWEKENDEKKKLKWTIDRIAKLNYNQIHQWQEKFPECRENNTPANEHFFRLARVALGGYGKEEEDKFRNKIMKNVLKEVVLDKKNMSLK